MQEVSRLLEEAPVDIPKRTHAMVVSKDDADNAGNEQSREWLWCERCLSPWLACRTRVVAPGRPLVCGGGRGQQENKSLGCVWLLLRGVLGFRADGPCPPSQTSISWPMPHLTCTSRPPRTQSFPTKCAKVHFLRIAPHTCCLVRWATP